MKIERILVGTDLSPRAIAALPAVAGLARQLQAEVELLYADDLASGLSGAAGMRERREVEGHMASIASAADVWGLSARGRVLSGTPTQALRAAAERDRHALLTLVHEAGRRGAASVARALAAEAAAPILVVHAPMAAHHELVRPEALTFRRVACAVDLDEGRSHALDAAIAFCAAIGAKPLLLSVVHARGVEVLVDGDRPRLAAPPPAVAAEVHVAQLRLTALAASLGDEHVGAVVVAAADVAAGVAAAALDAEADLLIVAPRQRGKLARALLGSVTDRLLRLSPLPMLVMAESAAVAMEG